MAAPSEYYVDISVASDGGSGASGSPWTRADGGAIQYALDTITRNSTNGDRINIKGTAHTDHPAALDLTTYGAPTNGAPLWFQGYGSTAGDGTRASITQSGPGIELLSTGFNSTHIHDLDIEAMRVSLGGYCSVINCLVSSGAFSEALLLAGANCIAMGNVITVNDSDTGIAITQSSSLAYRNYIVFASGSTGIGIDLSGFGSKAIGNIIDAGASDIATGIRVDSHGTRCSSNSIYANGSTGRGIWVPSGSWFNPTITDNLVEGFSGTGGVGIETEPNTNRCLVVSNSVYNCATAYQLDGDQQYISALLDNETLGASPFTDAANDDFTPVDTGNVLAPVFGTLNGSDILCFRGAVAPATGGGSGYPRSRVFAGSHL